VAGAFLLGIGKAACTAAAVANCLYLQHYDEK